ncbi:MAG: hypothetical protein A4E42_01613 [Methanoregulaceae archaeon PtaU1.Bin222]|nr:MAG: hypothetical protein A4E42_01613 [Methanoregulaceae archaeon PtaU1.Bin222]
MRSPARGRSSTTPAVKYKSAINTTPTAMLLSGPIRAMGSSTRGSGAFSSMEETPPKIRRVMLLIGTPILFATMQWAISWRSTPAKRPSATIAPTI